MMKLRPSSTSIFFALLLTAGVARSAEGRQPLIHYVYDDAVERVRVVAVLGGSSQATYVTTSGREVPAATTADLHWNR